MLVIASNKMLCPFCNETETEFRCSYCSQVACWTCLFKVKGTTKDNHICPKCEEK